MVNPQRQRWCKFGNGVSDYSFPNGQIRKTFVLFERLSDVQLNSLIFGTFGSGVTEAACKTLVKQRLGGAGMRWTSRGAHVVLQLRAAALTNSRWNAFWRKISLYGVVIDADCTA